MLYLWIDRDEDDWRAIPNPARDFDLEIRETVRLVWGRAPKAVRYLERPPRRECIITQRRIPEHRERLRREEDRRNKILLEYKREEWRCLAANPPDLRTCRTIEELRVKLDTIAWDRAKRRLDRQGLASTLPSWRSGEPPLDPLPWPPPSHQHDRASVDARDLTERWSSKSSPRSPSQFAGS